MRDSSRREAGQRAETQAQQFLELHGLELVARNYRCRSGELDLVMLDKEALVIVEVRYRSRSDFMPAQESVDWRKQARLIRATEHFLLGRHNLRDRPIRFDVLAVAGEEDGAVTWIRDAFQA